MSAPRTITPDATTMVVFMAVIGMLIICIAYGLAQINTTLEEIRDRLPVVKVAPDPNDDRDR